MARQGSRSVPRHTTTSTPDIHASQLRPPARQNTSAEPGTVANSARPPTARTAGHQSQPPDRRREKTPTDAGHKPGDHPPPRVIVAMGMVLAKLVRTPAPHRNPELPTRDRNNPGEPATHHLASTRHSIQCQPVIMSWWVPLRFTRLCDSSVSEWPGCSGNPQVTLMPRWSYI